MQLVAYGAQDIYLTGNPQITFFKVVYRRHTNFSMESIQQTFSGGQGANPVCTISRNGDLVHKMYLVQTADTYTPDMRVPQPIITVELEIGGQRIDRQSGQWMDTWNELSTPESKAIGLKAMTGQIGTTASASVGYVHIPLQFWFCRNPGLALPLIALQYHEVKVKFTLATNAQGGNFELFCDYIYLDTDERRRFAQVSHEYLIEQVQEQTAASDGKNKLNFNHPVKELIWSTTDQATEVGLKLNGHDRFSSRKSEYFYLQQPYDYHTAVPKQNLPAAAQISILDRQTSFTLPTDGTHSLFASYTGQNPSDDDYALTNTEARFEITDAGRICFVGFATSLVRDDFDTQNPLGTEFIINIDGTSFRVVRDGGIGGEISFTTFTNISGSASDFNDAVKAVTTNIVIQGTAVDLSGAAVTALIATDTQVISVFRTTNNSSNQARTSKDSQPIGVYSFALKPEEHQPSGTCNFSRIDNAELTFTTKGQLGTIYAVNYNVLRIMSGMGGLAYSN